MSRSPHFDHEAGILSLAENFYLQRWCEDAFCKKKQQQRFLVRIFKAQFFPKSVLNVWDIYGCEKLHYCSASEYLSPRRYSSQWPHKHGLHYWNEDAEEIFYEVKWAYSEIEICPYWEKWCKHFLHYIVDVYRGIVTSRCVFDKLRFQPTEQSE